VSKTALPPRPGAEVARRAAHDVPARGESGTEAEGAASTPETISAKVTKGLGKILG